MTRAGRATNPIWGEQSAMSHANAYAIEVQGRSAGIVVAERGGFTFFVSDWAFRDLDRRVFRNVGQAQRAAHQHYSRLPDTRRR